MPIVIVKQKVKDLDVWKKAFEDGAAMRAEAGCTVWSAAHEIAEPNTIVVVSDWATLEGVRKFLDGAKDMFARSGVVSGEVRVIEHEIKL